MSQFSTPYRLYSPYIKKGRFYNYPGEHKPHALLPSIFNMLRWCFRKRHVPVDLNDWVLKSPVKQNSMPLSITWIGHSTFLIQIGGMNILTDPIFGTISLLFKRFSPPGIALKDLPPIDFVLISHNHRDHMDAHTLQVLRARHPGITFLVPQGDKAWFRKRGFDRVTEHMWWDKQIFVSTFDGRTRIEFSFMPAFHWSQRSLLDYNKSLWGGWMISCRNTKIFFAGDTAYSDHFKHVAQEHPDIEIALLPIGPCEPRSWMSYSHINAEDAVRAFIDLKAKHFIPMHWGTYPFGVDHFAMPLERLLAYWKNRNMDTVGILHAPKIGEQISFEPSIIEPQPSPYLHLFKTF